MITLKIILLVIATWKIYRLVASDTGYHCFLRKLRIKLGVVHTKEWSEYTTPDGSIAEGLTCVKCAPIWWGFGLTLLMLFAPDWLYFLIVLPLVACAFAMIIENRVYKKKGED